MSGIRNEDMTRSMGMGLLLAFASITLALTGCHRGLYRRQADRESYYLLQEKSIGTPWSIPDWFTVSPAPESRFFDATHPDFPTLPPAGPQLYQYRLPQLRGAERGGAVPSQSASPGSPGSDLDPEELPVPSGLSSPPPDIKAGPPRTGVSVPNIQVVSYQAPAASPTDSDQEDPFRDDLAVTTDGRATVRGMRVVAVGKRFWDDLPAQCVSRILDFASVRDEYQLSYGAPPAPEQLRTTPRATFDDLFELALLNSRAYQLEKEQLYQTALTLSLERFAFATKFTARGNTVDTTFTHRRIDGTTVNSLAVPSTLRGDKLTATGGTLVGRFANDVLLTFHGPSGFAADVSSELLFEITQGVFQRDILLEPLIQSERDVVYAARSFARFRKEFFFDIAVTYYNILLTYREIEIEAQNYFSQVRNFQQAREEVESQISSAPNVTSLNQFEQGVLTVQSGVIQRCLRLEDELDAMKLTLGLPTETPLDVDLTELEQLTLADLIEVNREQAKRWEERLRLLREKNPQNNHADILTTSYSLAERLITWLQQRRRIDPSIPEPGELRLQRILFQTDAARLDALAERALLRSVLESDPPKQAILVFQRQVDMINAQLLLIQRLGQLATMLRAAPAELDRARQEYRASQKSFEKLQGDLDDALEKNPDDATVIGLIDRATTTLAGLDTLGDELDELLSGGPVDTVDLAETLARCDALLRYTRDEFAAADQGLPPMEIGVDDAMVTALIQRLDLMNQRGELADRWREIKIAADELRSRLDLGASQTIGTRKNRPFDFSLDNAETRVRIAWDLPLNRKRDRNLYRRALIGYNAQLRSQQQFEDTIKLNVRGQLRDLEQARFQYPISVAQAALAEEQVLSTRLQLILGRPEVRAIDLLFAYDDSREALAAMVGRRIGYMVQRARFALEMEVMLLDDAGFWPSINDPQYQPQPNFVYPWNAGAAYGDFPSFLKVSHEFRRMLNYPPPSAAPFPAQTTADAVPTPSDPALLEPLTPPAPDDVRPPSDD